ncbi:MFS general substrate transporter [Zopfia rhizophila CBS 207.26]|uniref:MFS general substrate transporter n=1 Tax=Zopfia rhizophila CBS 207.26 TaxID=1314779 RepID=A0A6A6DTR9_9PEZI|nr:MFS general substrate transporter [Zopfia rhizophila CBS 207.26]
MIRAGIRTDFGCERAADIQGILLRYEPESPILRKLDLRILSVLWILYLVCFVDRSSIRSAKIASMEKYLSLKGQRYNIVRFTFNIWYLIAGIPLSILFKRTGPKSLAVMMFCWGVTMIGFGLTRSWARLVVCNCLEGMAEAAYVPGAAHLIGSYYRKNEFLKGYVIFFFNGICAGAFNGYLVDLISKVDGVGGYRAWRWIVIIEDVVTIAVSVISFFSIVPFLDDSTIFRSEDKALLRIVTYLKDWKIWLLVMVYIGATENVNSITNFRPTILRGTGYTSTQAQVHTIPVYLIAAAYSISMASFERVSGTENFFFFFFFLMLGFAIWASVLIVEIAQPKNEVGFALWAIVCWRNVGSFIGTNVFLKPDESKFRMGFSTGLGLACMGANAATAMYVGLRWGIRGGRRERG